MRANYYEPAPSPPVRLDVGTWYMTEGVTYEGGPIEPVVVRRTEAEARRFANRPEDRVVRLVVTPGHVARHVL